jgi:hypothetical protein
LDAIRPGRFGRSLFNGGQINWFIVIGQPVSSEPAPSMVHSHSIRTKPIDFSINFNVFERYGPRREEKRFPGETARG